MAGFGGQQVIGTSRGIMAPTGGRAPAASAIPAGNGLGVTQVPLSAPQSGGGSNPAIIASIQNMLSQPPQAQVPAINNVAAANPQAQQANNALMQRAQTDMGASDAMRLSGVGNADQAAMLMADAGKNASRRGVGSSGAAGLMKRDIANSAFRTQAGENSRIAFNSERAKDQQLTNVRGGALDQDASNRADRQLALNQYDSANQTALSQQRLQQEKLQSVLNLLGPMGGFF